MKAAHDIIGRHDASVLRVFVVRGLKWAKF